jgi:hypothetical protein
MAEEMSRRVEQYGLSSARVTTVALSAVWGVNMRAREEKSADRRDGIGKNSVAGV